MATVYEHGTLASLMAGSLGGTITLGELMKHGSEGLGTFDGLDGEVVMLDGEVYQATSDGVVHHVTDKNVTLPFASVHFPGDDQQDVSVEAKDLKDLTTKVTDQFNLKNVFAYVRLQGTFDHVKIRIAPKQERPYPSLLKVAENQPTFVKDQAEGEVVGYYSPAIFGTVTSAGWHLHFISEDRQFEGHLLELDGTKASGKLEVFDSFEQHLPVNDKDFRNEEVDLKTLSASIEAAES